MLFLYQFFFFYLFCCCWCCSILYPFAWFVSSVPFTPGCSRILLPPLFLLAVLVDVLFLLIFFCFFFRFLISFRCFVIHLSAWQSIMSDFARVHRASKLWTGGFGPFCTGEALRSMNKNTILQIASQGKPNGTRCSWKEGRQQQISTTTTKNGLL